MTAHTRTVADIRAKVDRFSSLLHARDLAIVDEVWSPGFQLVGSEAGERAGDREGLVRLFTGLFARSVRYSFAFPLFIVEEAGDIAWLSADGDLQATGADGSVGRFAYRLTAVFERTAGGWRWRLFSGAEPAKPVEA